MVGLTASSPVSSEREVGNASEAECGLLMSYGKIAWVLSLKTVQNDTIYKKHFVGVGSVQNHRSPSSSEPEAGDVRPQRRYAPIGFFRVGVKCSWGFQSSMFAILRSSRVNMEKTEVEALPILQTRWHSSDARRHFFEL